MNNRILKFKRKGLDDFLQIGKYKNCRIIFVIKIDPAYLVWMEKENLIRLTKEAERHLTEKMNNILNPMEVEDEGMEQQIQSF